MTRVPNEYYYRPAQLLKKASEYDQEIPQSHTTYQSTASWAGATEHHQSQYMKTTIEAKQPALSFPSIWLQN